MALFRLFLGAHTAAPPPAGDVTVAAVGAAAAAALGTATATGGAITAATGFARPAALGTATAYARTITAATGAAAATASGTVTVTGKANVAATGAAAATALGTVEAYGELPAPGTDAGWDSSIDYAGKVSFADGDRIAIAAADAGSRELWSLTTHNSGKHFAEVVFNDGAATSVGMLSPDYRGAYITQGGTVYVARTVGVAQYLDLFPPLVEGDVIGMAIDITAGKAWFRVNGGPWNNDPTQGPV